MAPAESEIAWSVRCEAPDPCGVIIEGSQALVTGRGHLRCAARGETLGCLFSSRDGRSHDAWFVSLRDRSVLPIRIDPGQALLAEPVWDPDGLRIMLRRADGSLTTRTVVAPKVTLAHPGLRSWARQVGDADDEPVSLRLCMGADGLLWTTAGARFRLDDGSATEPAAFSARDGDGMKIEALELLPGGDALLAGTVTDGARGFHGATAVRVAGGSLGGRDLILLRLGQDGTVLWRRTWGSASDEQLVSLGAPADRIRVEASYGGLVDLDPGEGTSLRMPPEGGRMVSTFDTDGRFLSEPEQAPGKAPLDCQTAGQVPPECQTDGKVNGQVPPECQLRLGQGPVPRAPRSADLRRNRDRASTWVGCFVGAEARWMFVAPTGVALEDADQADGRLCVGGTARGGPHDLAVRPTQTLYVGDPEVESVAFVACLDLEETLGAP